MTPLPKHRESAAAQQVGQQMTYVSDLCSSVSPFLLCSPVPLSSLPLNPFFHPSFSLLPSFHSSCTSSLYSGCCQATDMYVEQLKDVLKHSCPKRIAGFFAEPIQVRLTTRTQTGKVYNLCYLSLSIPSLPSPFPCLSLFFLPPPFFLSLFLPPLLSLSFSLPLSNYCLTGCWRECPTSKRIPQESL